LLLQEADDKGRDDQGVKRKIQTYLLWIASVQNILATVELKRANIVRRI
jgi:hypothetical protein